MLECPFMTNRHKSFHHLPHLPQSDLYKRYHMYSLWILTYTCQRYFMPRVMLWYKSEQLHPLSHPSFHHHCIYIYIYIHVYIYIYIYIYLIYMYICILTIYHQATSTLHRISTFIIIFLRRNLQRLCYPIPRCLRQIRIQT